MCGAMFQSRNPRMHIDVKICGITCTEDASFASDSGADYVGFVFHRHSPRYVTPAAAREICLQVPGTVKKVGVFVNMPASEVTEVVEECRLDVVQLHGDEDAAGYVNVAKRIWRALRLVSGKWTPDPNDWKCERMLVDATVADGRYGGTGATADWTTARQLASKRSVMLAGGLTAENVASGIETVRPAGVDVVSGVEAFPGRKDPVKVKRFIDTVRSCEARIESSLPS